MIRLLLLAIALQTPQDSAHVRLQQKRLDSVRVVMDSLRRWCRITSYQTPKYLRKTCPMALASPDARARYAEDSLLQGTVPQPQPQPQPLPQPQPQPVPSGPAELPRQYIAFQFPAPTRTIQVAAGASLQAALDAAVAGDELVLAAGATYTGNYSITSCPATWITLRSAGVLTSSTTRARPSTSTGFAKLVTANNEPALYFRPGSCNWRAVGIEVTIAPSVSAEVYGIVRMEGVRLSITNSYLHGQPASQVPRCATMNGAWQEIAHSWLSECHGDGFDSQAIHGARGSGPFRIVNNYLEGAGENIMFGGQDPLVAGLVPADIEIRGNHIAKPASWVGTGWDIKNLLELKNAVRVLIEGNVLEGSWNANQTGWAVVLMSANQDGNCRWCRTQDITIRRNLIRNAGAGVNIAGSVGSDSTTTRVAILENVLTSLNVAPYFGDARGFQTLRGSKNVTVSANVTEGNLTAIYYGEIGSGSFCTAKGNQWVSGTYGVHVDGGSSSLTDALNKICGLNQWTWESNYFGSGTVVSTPEATAIRALVSTATAGVVVQP